MSTSIQNFFDYNLIKKVLNSKLFEIKFQKKIETKKWIENMFVKFLQTIFTQRLLRQPFRKQSIGKETLKKQNIL